MAISPRSKGLGNIGGIVNRQRLAAPTMPVARPVARPVSTVNPFAGGKTTTMAQRQAMNPFRSATKPAMPKVNPMQPAPQPFNPQPTQSGFNPMDYFNGRSNIAKYDPSMGGTEDLYNQYNQIRNRISMDVRPEDRMNYQQFVNYRNGTYTPPSLDELYGPGPEPTQPFNPNPTPGGTIWNGPAARLPDEAFGPDGQLNTNYLQDMFGGFFGNQPQPGIQGPGNINFNSPTQGQDPFDFPQGFGGMFGLQQAFNPQGTTNNSSGSLFGGGGFAGK